MAVTNYVVFKPKEWLCIRSKLTVAKEYADEMTVFTDMPNNIEFFVVLSPTILSVVPWYTCEWESSWSPSQSKNICCCYFWWFSHERKVMWVYSQAQKGIESICWMSATDLWKFLASGSFVWQARTALKISLILDLSHERHT